MPEFKPETKAIHKSNGARGALLTIALGILVTLGAISDDVAKVLAEEVPDLVEAGVLLFSGCLALWGRIKATQPLSLRARPKSETTPGQEQP